MYARKLKTINDLVHFVYLEQILMVMALRFKKPKNVHIIPFVNFKLLLIACVYHKMECLMAKLSIIIILLVLHIQIFRYFWQCLLSAIHEFYAQIYPIIMFKKVDREE